MKTCTKCKKELLLELFDNNKSRKDGKASVCKSCRKEESKIFYEKNKEKILKRVNKRSVDKKDDIEIYRKNYYKNNKDIISIRGKIYREENKKEITFRRKESRIKNKEKLSIQRKKYRLLNLEKIRKRERDCAKRKIKNWKSNPNYILKARLRTRLNSAIKKEYKSGSAVKDLGCSIEELKQHLEKQFYPNPETGEEMTWQNYGLCGWHIDHIIPLAKFNLTNREELLKACNYSNLQPLWAEENLKKGDKISE